MAPQFKDCTARPEYFFSILPPDWRGDIAPVWGDYKDTANIFILESGKQAIGGGIVFSSVSPDTMIYGAEAQHWFDEGYLYIGFLWIAEQHRGKQLGSSWLQQLIRQFPHQKFWLSIDDYQLLPFYERNGFRLMKEVETASGKEWILTTN